MSIEKARKYCQRCNAWCLAERMVMDHTFHLLVSSLTGLIWLPFWLFFSLQKSAFLCPKCGQNCRVNDFLEVTDERNVAPNDIKVVPIWLLAIPIFCFHATLAYIGYCVLSFLWLTARSLSIF